MKNVVSLTKFSLTENISAGSNSLAINLSIDLITFFVVPTSYHILIEIPFILLKFLKYLNTRGNSWSSGSVRRKINWPGIVFICCNPEIGRVDFVDGFFCTKALNTLVVDKLTRLTSNGRRKSLGHGG